MNHYGNIRKMHSELKDEVEYTLPLYDSTVPSLEVELNDLIGSTIKISFSGTINCVVTGKKIRKAYGEGMSYDAFKLENGKWILHEDVIGVNKGVDPKKQYMYVQDEKTGKVQRKEVKVQWENPEDPNAPVNGSSHVAVTPETEVKDTEQKEDVNLPEVDKRDKRDPSDLSVYGNKKKKKKKSKRKRN